MDSTESLCRLCDENCEESIYLSVISSDVRRKLGLDSRGENLGPAIRNLMDGEKAGARREGCAAAKSAT